MASRKGYSTKARSRGGWVLRILVIALTAFLFLKAVQLYGQLREKQQAMAELNNRIQTQIVVNEGLADQVENADEYLEHKANEDGYYMSGQQVYQNEAG